jgi:hypothetical protein
MSNAELAGPFQELLAAARANVALLLTEGQRRGEIRTDIAAVELARLLQQSMLGTQILWSLRPPSDLDAAVDQMLDVLWRGVGSTPLPVHAGPGGNR